MMPTSILLQIKFDNKKAAQEGGELYYPGEAYMLRLLCRICFVEGEGKREGETII